jgi:nuclear GTP-binding protein
MAKRQTKRMTFKKQYFIKKKVRDHNRKQRKKDRENGKKGIRKRTLRDPGIPNNCPFKKELMEQLEHQREQEERDKQLHKERLQKQRELERSQLDGTAPKKSVERPPKKPKKTKGEKQFLLRD